MATPLKQTRKHRPFQFKKSLLRFNWTMYWPCLSRYQCIYLIINNVAYCVCYCINIKSCESIIFFRNLLEKKIFYFNLMTRRIFSCGKNCISMLLFFYQITALFDTSVIPDDLKPYLSLFLEVLFELPLTRDGSKLYVLLLGILLFTCTK